MVSPIENKTNVEQIESIITTSVGKKKDSSSGLVEEVASFYRLILFVLIIGGISTGALILFLVYRSDITTLKSEINIKTVELESRMADLEKLKSMKIDYADLEASDKKIIDILPMEKDVPKYQNENNGETGDKQ